MNLEIHPFAEEIPRMTKEEFKELVDDIKVNGLKERIILYKGKILDGRHRFEALEELGWPIEDYVEEFDEEEEGDPLAYVISRNIMRRHLPVGQRAGLFVSMYANLPKSKGGRPATNPVTKYEPSPEIGSGSGRKPVTNVTPFPQTGRSPSRPVLEIERVTKPVSNDPGLHSCDVPVRQPTAKELAKKAHVNERAIKRERAKQEGRKPATKPAFTMRNVAKTIQETSPTGGGWFEWNECIVAVAITKEAKQKLTTIMQAGKWPVVA